MNSKSVFSNLIWRFAERVGAQLVSLVVSIVLARLLMPEDYGTISLIMVFISVLNVFLDSGLGTALIQKKDADNLDFSTVFWTNLGVGILLYALMFFCAPAISDFYGRSELCPVIRVLSLSLLISSVKNVQQAYVSRHMIFKRFFFATLGGTVGAAVIGIWMAYEGYGVWALVAQQLFNMTVDTIILWITVRWRPEFVFSLERLKGLFGYGWKLLASAFLETGYNKIRELIIGKIYSSADLAYYNKGLQFPDLLVTNINSSIDSVLLPAMSDVQEDKNRVKEMTRRSMKISLFIMAPIMIGLAAVSQRFIVLLLTEKWASCVPYLCIFCIIYMFYPVHTANLNAMKAMGRSDLFLKLEIIKKVIGLAALFATMFISPLAMCIGLLISDMICLLVNAWPNRKLLGYSIKEQILDMIPPLLLATGMGICVYFVGVLCKGLPDILVLGIQVLAGAALYVLGSVVCKMESFTYCLDMAKEYLPFLKGREK